MGGKGACGLHCTKINNISVKFGKEQVLKNDIYSQVAATSHSWDSQHLKNNLSESSD